MPSRRHLIDTKVKIIISSMQIFTCFKYKETRGFNILKKKLSCRFYFIVTSLSSFFFFINRAHVGFKRYRSACFFIEGDGRILKRFYGQGGREGVGNHTVRHSFVQYVRSCGGLLVLTRSFPRAVLGMLPLSLLVGVFRGVGSMVGQVKTRGKSTIEDMQYYAHTFTWW